MSGNIHTIEWKTPPSGVLGFTSKRFGGVSSDRYAGLNLGINTKDSAAKVFKNYKLLEFHSGLKNIIILNQVHGSKVLEVTADNYAEICLSEADGLFTMEKDIALAIQTADCFPILLAGKNGIAALHCGWRSLNSGIIENSVTFFEKYDDYPEYAYVGPGICKDCYEIKDDMVKLLNKKYEPETALIDLGDGKYKFDLRKETHNALKANAIKFIEDCGFTSCHSEGFYSYRRDGGDTGRMLSVVARSGHVRNG